MSHISVTGDECGTERVFSLQRACRGKKKKKEKTDVSVPCFALDLTRSLDKPVRMLLLFRQPAGREGMEQ